MRSSTWPRARLALLHVQLDDAAHDVGLHVDAAVRPDPAARVHRRDQVARAASIRTLDAAPVRFDAAMAEMLTTAMTAVRPIPIFVPFFISDLRLHEGTTDRRLERGQVFVELVERPSGTHGPRAP
jgi:hypothetical protein